MSTTLVTSKVGGIGRSSNPKGSIFYTSADDTISLLTGGASEDGKFLRFNWNSGSPTLTAEEASVTAASLSFSLTSDISPPQLTADVNDYNPTNWLTASVIRLTSDATRNITGLSIGPGGADGRILIIHNVGSNNIVLNHENSSSDASNRFKFPGSTDVTLQPDDCVCLLYDNTTGRWRGFATHFGKLPIARGGTNSGTTLNNNRIMVSSSGAIVEAGAMTNGQILIGSTGAAPVVASITAGSNITVTNGAGSITIAATGGATSPFSASAGVITYTTSTDRLKLVVGEIGDVGFELGGIAAQTADFVQIKLLAADANPAIKIDKDMQVKFGAGGGSATDVVFYRSGVSTLTMNHAILSGVATSGAATTLQVSPGNHLAQTAEVNDLIVNAHTNTITSAYATQRFSLWAQPTITAASALTVTSAATLAIAGAPIAGGSAIITNAYALWVQAGKTRLDGQTILNTVTYTWPSADGTASQFLQTNGSGTLSWATAPAAGSSPFTATGGIIDYSTATDRLRLKIGEVGDTGIEINGIAAQTSDYVLVKALAADANGVLALDSASKMWFGAGGGTARDTNLYRSSADTLKTDDALTVTGILTVGTGPTTHTDAAGKILSAALNTVLIAQGGTNSVTALNNNRIMVSSAGSIVEAGAMTNGQVLIGSTSAAPVVATLTGTSNQITVTNGAGSITLSTPQDINTTSAVQFKRVTVTGVATSGGDYGIKVLPANHTAVIAEQPSTWTTANTLTITASYTPQRFAIFEGPTITAGSVLTVTNSATVAITNAPTAAGSAVITNKYALWLQAGDLLAAGLIKAGTTPITITTAAGKLVGTALDGGAANTAPVSDGSAVAWRKIVGAETLYVNYPGGAWTDQLGGSPTSSATGTVKEDVDTSVTPARAFLHFEDSSGTLKTFGHLITWQVPWGWSDFATSNCIVLTYRTESTNAANNKLDITIRDKNNTQIGQQTAKVSSVANTWTTAVFNKADLSVVPAAGERMHFECLMYSLSGNHTEIAELAITPA